jgi:hypothetical protein
MTNRSTVTERIYSSALTTKSSQITASFRYNGSQEGKNIFETSVGRTMSPWHQMFIHHLCGQLHT